MTSRPGLRRHSRDKTGNNDELVMSTVRDALSTSAVSDKLENGDVVVSDARCGAADRESEVHTAASFNTDIMKSASVGYIVKNTLADIDCMSSF